MSNPSNIERVVMRRVHTIHFIRPFFSVEALAFAVFAAALWGIGREVWVAHVFQNAPHSENVFATIRFYFSAFENTRLLVQVLALTTFAALIYLARETARNLASLLTPARV
ncbi:MAG: hypothetical protein Q7S95_03425 [bacterium]|nr:hypothetical protein [bacterium]